MADYYPLIARAIAGLDPSAPGESRRALYERARAALIAQLRSVQPPLSESEITRERLSLEEAVRKVESEAAQRARDASRSADAARSGGERPAPATRSAPPPGRRRGRPSRRRRLRPRKTRRRRPRGRGHLRRRRRATSARRSVRTTGSAAPRTEAPVPPRPQPPQLPIQDPPLPPTRERAGAPRRGPDNSAPQAPGMRGFRDIAADADDLGRAAAQANRAARKTYANVPSPSPEFDRLEPNMENRGADPDAPYSYDELVEEAERYAAPPSAPRPRLAGDREPKKQARRGAVFPFKSAIAIGIVLILVGAGILWGKVGGDHRQLAIQAGPGRGSAQGQFATRKTEDSRSGRPAVVDRAGRAGGAAASCCMTRIPPIPRASNMSAR